MSKFIDCFDCVVVKFCEFEVFMSYFWIDGEFSLENFILVLKEKLGEDIKVFNIMMDLGE